MTRTAFLALVLVLIMVTPAQASCPIADAGLPRYAATEPVQLDGTGSHDPDNSGPLSYQWRQISGPAVDTTGQNTPRPTISGFTQTDSRQVCEFELVVSDGQCNSLPDTVEVIIVPQGHDACPFRVESGSFDPEKPTIIVFFRGGSFSGGPEWESRANIISFTKDIFGSQWSDKPIDCNRCGDNLIVYLSSVAPDYKRPIQTISHSGGGWTNPIVTAYLNLSYVDARYAVNHATYLDGFLDGDPPGAHRVFLNNPVDGEQCWLEHYPSTNFPDFLHCLWGCPPFDTFLQVKFPVPPADHGTPVSWYKNSLTNSDMNQFNSPAAGPGVVGGAYWSVVGPGKNLQLGSVYGFEWHGSTSSGYMDLHDEPNYPSRLPEPVRLINAVAGGVAGPNPAPEPLTCEESGNAVGYQLLFGSDPYRVMDYTVISDTPYPPTEVITTFPFEKTYWTIKVRDQYGSSIYADPVYVNSFILTRPIENLSNGKRYGYLQDAIDEANSGDQIVARPGTYYESINFKGKNLTLRSTEPGTPAVVARTVISGDGNRRVVTFSGAEGADSVLAGLTISGGGVGIDCSGRDTTPTVVNCLVTGNRIAGIKLTEATAAIENCVIAENWGDGIQYNHTRCAITNCTIAGNCGVGVKLSGSSAIITNSIIWGNLGPAIDCKDYNSVRATYSDIKGGLPGDGNIDNDPYFADAANGDYHLRSQAGRWDPNQNAWVTDGDTSPCIDAGDPTSDWHGEFWPHGKRINMGAYGGTPQASMSQSSLSNVADLNNDGTVSLPDFAELGNGWEVNEVLKGEDLNRDGYVDMVDLGMLADNWLWQE